MRSEDKSTITFYSRCYHFYDLLWYFYESIEDQIKVEGTEGQECLALMWIDLCFFNLLDTDDSF